MSVRWRDLPDDSDEDDGGVDQSRQYEQTLMYGRYKRDLEKFAKDQAQILRNERQTQDDSTTNLHSSRGTVTSYCSSLVRSVWKHSFARVGEDWIFLAVLGFVMAFISFLMDFGIGMCNNARIWLYRDLAGSSTILQYLSWVSIPVCLILFSAGFVHLTAPQAVGSGIPEMKTILRGVVLKEYLTFKTLIAKIVGLTATLGTGLPLGKEGPFVHIASIVATLLSKAVTSFKGIYENESRNSEMLAAACAVGVACSFAAPIGGVLFSIEVTSVYFAVRNYWRGFFAAVCGAMMFRLLAVWFHNEHTLTVLFKTSFKKDYPFDPMELFVFALIGAACGFFGAFFVWVHRQYVIFMRRNKKMKAFLQKSRLLYPFMTTLVYSTLSFPPGFGMFVCSILTTHHQVVDLFSNITWTNAEPTVHEFEVVQKWRTPWTNIFVNLIIYIVYTFCGSVVASTLPVPSGIFIPMFKMGAAFGRMIGEGMASLFPNGLSYAGINHIITPGGYSIVGAAAFAGAVTHTISTSVIVFELTGQITHILPVMIAVLIANGISQLLQPSVYDSIIRIKRLPYLPDILTSTQRAYNIYVEDFMIRDVKYIWYGITYSELKDILVNNKKIRSLPLVDSPASMILLGSVTREELITMIEEQMGADHHSIIVNKWKIAVQKALESNNQENKSANTSKISDEEEKVFSWHRSATVPADLPSFVLDEVSADDTAEIASTSSPEIEPLLMATDSVAGEEPIRPESLQLINEDNITIAVPNCEDSNERVKPSRFAVTKVETPSKMESSVTLQVEPVEIPCTSQPGDLFPPQPVLRRHTLPRKSILKKTHSFILPPNSSSPMPTPSLTPYATVHGGDSSKLRHAFEAIIRKRSVSKTDLKCSFNTHSLTPPLNSAKNNGASQKQCGNPEDKPAWEEEKLNSVVDFSKSHIDPAPFQLVERTSLLKVHSLFSMLGLNHAYVTAIGRLIGVVALPELRKAIEEANVGGATGKFKSEEPSTAANDKEENLYDSVSSSNRSKSFSIRDRIRNRKKMFGG